jgi:dTDP-4-dehydrorhamnose 3,5-epimerase
VNDHSDKTLPEPLIGAVKDRQSVTADWQLLRPLINGVQVKEICNVPKENGFLTEAYRLDWGLDGGRIEQVFQVSLLPGALSAWHAHRLSTDRLFCGVGLIKLVLFDARKESPSHGMVNELRIGEVRPGVVVVPPGVWHGVQNLWPGTSRLLNMVDRAYSYEDPDHWRLPPDTAQIPYSFEQTPRSSIAAI